jgi:hypothetical protein
MEVVRRTLSLLLAAVVAGLLLMAAPRWASAGEATPPAQSSATSVPATEPVMTLAGDRDITQCVSAVERPGCDSGNKGGILYAVMGALVAGLVFIGWRIVRSVRQREQAMSGPPTR